MAEGSSGEPDFRILLVGRTGDGKSSTGNTIVGDNVFPQSNSSLSVTKTCKWEKTCTRFGKTIEVVDTPGFFDTEMDNMMVHKELLKALVLTTPGFHAIAFVLKRGTRFTDEVRKTTNLFVNWFGSGIENHACLILTDTNSQEEKEEYLRLNSHVMLSELVQICKNNIVPINNKAKESLKHEQVKYLLGVLENIKTNNKNKYFSNIGFRLAEKYIKYKCSSVLTKNSLRLLQSAGLQMEVSKGQYMYHDKVFSLMEEETESTPEKTLLDSSLMKQEPKKVGNLTIIDNATNEIIPNIQTQPVKDIKRNNIENCSDQLDEDAVDEVEVESSEVSERRTVLKKSISDGRNENELKGFFNFFRRVWRRYKDNNCTLL